MKILATFCAALSSASLCAEPVTHIIGNENTPDVYMTVDGGSEGSVSIGIYQRTTDKPYVTLADIDGDGVFDLLSYSVLDKNGGHIMEVEDYGMDGQADFKTNMFSGAASIHINGEWYESVGSTDEDRYFLIGKKKVLVREAVHEMRVAHGLVRDTKKE
ncbi:hypothetical protein QSV34_10305 [Porticoccus sp. W117]|uniref:hypothetical protein n=1 Tax=Porticoccus sp. W117 TaxID=3054777 RepID=UPI00259ACBCD|nr:hypothetical protein [Porticoccus sp. W117]MDM3871741.1 hypothetical protein [Porticoccus sp. W117]